MNDHKQCFETAHELSPKAPEGELGLSKAGCIALHANLGANGGPTIAEEWQVLAANAPGSPVLD